MPIYSEQLDQCIKGALMEKEDCWNVCYDTDTLEIYVEHIWNHVDAHNVASGVDSGIARHPLDVWRHSAASGPEKVDAAVIAVLEKAYTSRGIAEV